MDTTATISSLQAFILGIVEGITEYLPISSTGHLVITSDLIGLRDLQHLSPAQIEAVQAFEVVIQSGAILAVLLLYRHHAYETFLGALGKSAKGRRLLVNIACATMPILVAGFLLKGVISTYLQFTGPVLIALVVGGLAMIAFEKFRGRKGAADSEPIAIEDLTWKQALMVGGLQCLALWPGTSRSMVTIMGGMMIGLKKPVAAEFSFLIGLPALLAATAYKALKNGDVLIAHVGASSLLIGLATSTIFAAFAVRWLVSFLGRSGLAPFGWYRLALAAVVFLVIGL